MEPPTSNSPALNAWSTSDNMRATDEAIKSANQVAKDLAIRSAKAADKKRMAKKKIIF